YRKGPASAAGVLTASPASVTTDPPPPWVYSSAAAEPPPVRLLSPAAAYDEATPPRAPSGSRMERDKALERGRLVHRLLQALADVPEPYAAQLALYRAVLRRLYPGKHIRAALVWTDLPDLMEISDARLDAALAAITSP